MTITGYRLGRWQFSSLAEGMLATRFVSCCPCQPSFPGFQVCRMPVKKQLCPVRFLAGVFLPGPVSVRHSLPPLLWLGSPFCAGQGQLGNIRLHHASAQGHGNGARPGQCFQTASCICARGPGPSPLFLPSALPSLCKQGLGSLHSPHVLPVCLLLRHLFRASV